MNKVMPLAFDVSKHARLKHWAGCNCRTTRHMNYFPRSGRQNSLNCCPLTTLVFVTDDLIFAKKSYSNEPIIKISSSLTITIGKQICLFLVRWNARSAECRKCGRWKMWSVENAERVGRPQFKQLPSSIRRPQLHVEILLEGKLNSTKVCRRIRVTSWPWQQFLKSATDAAPRLPENFVTHHTISWRRFQPKLNFRTGKRAEKSMLSV